MKTKNRIVLALLLLLGLYKQNYGQNSKQYTDSVNTYIKYVDSIIVECSINPACGISIVKREHNFPNLQKDSSLCGGAVLYKDDKNNQLLRLSYSGNCDSTFRLQDYYFDNNKIVFIRTIRSPDMDKKIDEYYQDAELVSSSATGKKYLNEGYELLRKISN